MERKTRIELQGLAKQKGIKANMTNKNIIKCLQKQTADCNKRGKSSKTNKTRKMLQALAKEKGIKANLSNDKIINCLQKQTPDCIKKTQKQGVSKSVQKTAKKGLLKTSKPEVKSVRILHELAYVPDDKYQYYNDGAKLTKTKSQIDALSEEQYYASIKQSYEKKKTLRAEIWPKDMNANNQVIPEASNAKLITGILSLCKKQTSDNIRIMFNKVDETNYGYVNLHSYSYKCNQVADIKRALKTVLNELQTFPFISADDYAEYKKNSNPFREEFGVVNVQVLFT